MPRTDLAIRFNAAWISIPPIREILCLNKGGILSFKWADGFNSGLEVFAETMYTFAWALQEKPENKNKNKNIIDA
jgi:hypothetical protein